MMKKVLRLCFAVLCLAMVVAQTASAEKPQKKHPSMAFLTGGGMTRVAGSCSIDCGDGTTHETDAGSVIECACDCASVCHATCEATDGSTTRTCSNA